MSGIDIRSGFKNLSNNKLYFIEPPKVSDSLDQIKYSLKTNAEI